MRKADPSVVDLIAGASSPKQTVKQRIDLRLKVLRAWLDEGIPFGKVIPKDLKAARLWNDDGLGVMKISSPNEFTSGHRFHGADVRQIADLLNKLQKKYGKPALQARAASASASTRPDRQAFDAQLRTTVSQWHSERDGRLSEVQRRQAAEARESILNQEMRQRDDLIADLTRQVSNHGSIRSVK